MGSIRQFHLFVKTLNELTKPYGIQFGDCQIGKEVNYLDLKFTLTDNNKIDYRLYKKDTDARLFLKTESFHPAHVFQSVVFSQMIRVIQRNSKDETCVQDLAELKRDLTRSGHSEATIEEMEPLAVQRTIENELLDSARPPKQQMEKVVFSLKYFKEINDLKKLVRSVKSDIEELCGEINVTFAIRKHQSIGNSVVRNRKLSEGGVLDDNSLEPKSQKCGGRGCQTCPYLFDSNETVMVNGLVVNLDFQLTCKDKSVIYLAQCQICSKIAKALKEDSYFGQTATAMHVRMNGHRNKFVIDNRLLFEKSALSMHCYLVHKLDFSMELFKLGIVKKVRPLDLDREEDKFINMYRTNVVGLNRIVVVR